MRLVRRSKAKGCSLIDTVLRIGRSAVAIVKRAPVTIGYLVALVGVSVMVETLDEHTRARLIAHASTNLHNLTHGRFSVLVSSAFVTDGGLDWILYPLLAAVLIAAELLVGHQSLVRAFAHGHLGATLIVAAGLLLAVRSGWISTSVMTETDVGVSYGAAAVLGAIAGALPVRWRATWATALVVAAVSGVALGRSFTDVGHLVALCLGLAIALTIPGLRTARPIGAGTVVMLSVAIVFALAIFGGNAEPEWAAPAAITAAATAATATRVTVRAADWSTGVAALARRDRAMISATT